MLIIKLSIKLKKSWLMFSFKGTMLSVLQHSLMHFLMKLMETGDLICMILSMRNGE